jgi:hypothetical protein
MHSLVRRIIERTETIYQFTHYIYDYHHYTIFGRMRLWRDSVRIHGRTGDDALLSLSRLPAIQRRAVFVFRDRTDGSIQARERLITLSCLAE